MSNSGSLDAFRGKRDYIRAADLLAVAPLDPAPLSLRFFMHEITSHPGKWRLTQKDFTPAPGEKIVADLTLSFRDRVEKWGFLVDCTQQIHRWIADIDEQSLVASIRIDERWPVVTMTDDFNLWEYMVASARVCGSIFAPGAEWLFVYLSMRFELIPQAISGRRMGMSRGRTRGRFVELNIRIDDATIGAIGVCRRS